MTCSKYTCDKYPALQPNPDVSGIGVLISFAVSAYLTFILCVASYLIDQDGASNPVDRLVIPALWGRRAKPSAKWGEALQKTVLSFSDQQIITGISILISGYSQLSCGLSVYHWVTIVNLAWFSAITHLTTLTSLRKYFQTRPALRWRRLIGMGVTVVMLGAALGPTGFLSTRQFPASFPAWCLYHPHSTWAADDEEIQRSSNSVYVAIVMCILGFGYLTRVIQLSSRASDITRSAFRTRPSKVLKGLLDRLKSRSDHATSHRVVSPVLSLVTVKGPHFVWVVMYRIFFSFHCLLKATVDLYSSMLWEITWLFIALVWGTIRILVNRNINRSFSSESEVPFSNEEDEWGFGQVLIVLMLIMPILSFLELCYEIFGTSENNRRSVSGPSTSLDQGDQPSISLLLDQNSGQTYDHLYEYKWFRKLLLLIYGLSLVAAGFTLFLCPYEQWADDLGSDPGLAVAFVSWFGLIVGITWIFTILCTLFQHADSVPQLHSAWRLVENSLYRLIPQTAKTRIEAIAWNCLIASLIASFLLFNCYYVASLTDNFVLPY